MPFPLAAVLSAAVPVIAGIFGARGQAQANRDNQAMVKQQMDFQERMSSTAVQRSVEDYRKAGLNPALAYDRSASSPGGGMATMGDVTGAGISSARAAAAEMQARRIAQQAHESQMGIDAAQRALLHNQSEKTTTEIAALRQQVKFNEINQPWDLQTRRAEALLREYLLPGAKNTADFEELIGKARPGIASAKTLAEILKLLNPQSFRR